VTLAVIRELKFALRQLSRAKVFTAVAVLTLALGIGCNTAIFSVFYAVLLRPLPFAEADRVVLVSEHTDRFPLLSASWQNFRDWRTQSTSFEEFGAVRSLTMSLNIGRVDCGRASGGTGCLRDPGAKSIAGRHHHAHARKLSRILHHAV
jgi:hypothetical protein